MAKTSQKSERSRARCGGSTFLGFLLGLITGLMIALVVAWYINKLPRPFQEKAGAPKTAQPYATKPAPKPAPPQPAAQQPQAPTAAEADSAKPAAEAPAPAKDVTTAPEKKSTPVVRDTFFLQTGSFQSMGEAESLRARLALLGLESAIQTRNLADKGIWHRVRVGPHGDMDELNRVRDVLKQNGIDVALVKVRESE